MTITELLKSLLVARAGWDEKPELYWLYGTAEDAAVRPMQGLLNADAVWSGRHPADVIAAMTDATSEAVRLTEAREERVRIPDRATGVVLRVEGYQLKTENDPERVRKLSAMRGLIGDQPDAEECRLAYAVMFDGQSWCYCMGRETGGPGPLERDNAVAAGRIPDGLQAFAESLRQLQAAGENWGGAGGQGTPYDADVTCPHEGTRIASPDGRLTTLAAEGVRTLASHLDLRGTDRLIVLVSDGEHLAVVGAGYGVPPEGTGVLCWDLLEAAKQISDTNPVGFKLMSMGPFGEN